MSRAPRNRRLTQTDLHRPLHRAAERNQRRDSRNRTLGLLALTMVCLELSVSAVSLKPETVQTWEAYVQGVSARNEEHLDPERSFLSTDEVPGQAMRLRAGRIVVSPVGPKVPLPV